MLFTHKARVLCIDDDDIMIEAMKRVLRDSHYDLDCCISPVQALEWMEENPYDVVISDVGMPGLNGIELLSEMYQRWPDSERLVLSGQSDFNVALAAINEGHVSRFFIKPCNTDELKLAIKDAIRKKELLEAARHLYQRCQDLEGTVEHLLNNAEEPSSSMPMPAAEGNIKIDWEDFLF